MPAPAPPNFPTFNPYRPIVRTMDDVPALREVVEHRRPRVWAQRHMLNDKGKPITFEDRPWQLALWDDTHPRQVTMKCSQIGETLHHLVKAIHSAIIHGRTCIYTMPTDKEAAKLVSGRVDRIIDRSALLRRLAGREGKGWYNSYGRYRYARPSDNTEQKHLGDGIIYFDGCKGESGALSIPADELYHDEVDHSDQETLEMFRSRLLALPYAERHVYQFSTPTTEKYGIAALYEAGDARQWLVRCPGCAWEGPLDYYEHTKGHLLELHCAACSAVLDPRDGRWVAQHPAHSEDTHSHHVVRMMDALPGNPQFLKALHEERQRSIYTWHFENMHLGVTSKAGVSTIDTEKVKRVAFVEEYYKMLTAQTGARGHYMGVDQGGRLNVLVGRADPHLDGGRMRVVWLQRLLNAQRDEEQWEELPKLMERYQVELCVIDANPDATQAHKFARRFPGRVLCCYYKDGQRTELQAASDIEKRALGAVRGQVEADERMDISVERTEALDNTSTDIQTGGILLPWPVEDLEMQEFLRQLEHNIRKPVLAADGTATNRWERVGGPNDYFHALNYLRLARTMSDQLATLPGRPVGSPLIIANAGTPGRRKR